MATSASAVSNRPIGWPWIEAVYPRETKLVLCGYPMVATWDRDPTGRYLLAGILEMLSHRQEIASE